MTERSEQLADYHGTRWGYAVVGCRCVDCNAAERRYRAQRKRREARGLGLKGGGQRDRDRRAAMRRAGGSL